jgi:hypothetical protein
MADGVATTAGAWSSHTDHGSCAGGGGGASCGSMYEVWSIVARFSQRLSSFCLSFVQVVF